MLTHQDTGSGMPVDCGVPCAWELARRRAGENDYTAATDVKGNTMRPFTLLLTGVLMSSNTQAEDVPYVAYIGRVADVERVLSAYNSESISQAFVDRQEVAVSAAVPATYTLLPGQSLSLLYHYTQRDANGEPQPQHPDFLNCGKVVRRVDGKPIQFRHMQGFTFGNDEFRSREADAHTRGLLHKFEPLLPVEQAKRTHAIWQFNAQDVAAFAADAVFVVDANQVAGKVLEFMCFHAENDPVPFIILRLDATGVAAGETADARHARLKAEREAAAAATRGVALQQRQADKQRDGAGATPAAAVENNADTARAQRVSDAQAQREAANARARAAAEARNAAARERKAALEAARAARREGGG